MVQFHFPLHFQHMRYTKKQFNSILKLIQPRISIASDFFNIGGFFFWGLSCQDFLDMLNRDGSGFAHYIANWIFFME